VSPGNTLFTLLGFMGLYTVLSILFIVLVYRTVHEGPSTGSLKAETKTVPTTLA